MKLLRPLAVLLAALTITSPAWALKEPRAVATDSRIRTVMYNPNEVYQFLGHYGYQSSVEFESGAEEVLTVSVGDSLAWQIVPAEDRIFLKPIEQDATTNMTVITNKRVYHFELHAAKAKDIRDPEMVFVLRFLYGGSMGYESASSDVPVPELDEDPSKYSFNYTIAGPDALSPVRIFDDGTFTYFQFRKSQEIPAFFIVDETGSEEILNYRARGDTIVIERLAPRFSLRSGSQVLCVYNENMATRGRPAAAQ